MKLLELDLHAYGPFSGKRLDLRGGDEGLHIVYGPNEAGKSSALRALHALLYGIPERTTDDFVHDKQALRIGGRLRSADGKEISLYRRKGRKNTLLSDVDGDALDDNIMLRILGGVDESLFGSLFGIDHAALVKGGETLLLEHGREAEALFESGLGNIAVQPILNGLDTRARELFAPQASKPQINQLLKQLKTTQAELRNVTLSARQWEEARKTRNRVQTDLASMERRISEESKRRSLLERARRVLPTLAKRQERRKRLVELQHIPRLPEDFSDSCTAAMNTRARATEDLKRSQSRIKSLEEQIENIKFSKDLIEQAERIDALREQLGGYRKANSDLPKLKSQFSDHRNRASGQLSVLRPDLAIDDIADILKAIAKRRRLTELSSQRDPLVAGIASTESALGKARRTLEEKSQNLSTLVDTPDPAHLKSAISRARALGEIDIEIASAETRIAEDKDKIQARLDTLGLWAGDLESLRTASLPSLETIQMHLDSEEALKRAQADALRDKVTAKAEIRKNDATIRRLKLTGDVPTEIELGEIREKRDTVWRLLRRKWLEGDDIEIESEPYGGIDRLPQAFESAMWTSDETADRLRREAQRVAEGAAASTQRESLEATVAEIDSKLDELSTRLSNASDEWRRLWSATGIDPLTPKEMAGWISKVGRIREHIEENGDQQATLRTRISTRNEAYEYLVDALTAVSDTDVSLQKERLTPLLAEAEDRFSEIEARKQRAAQLESACSELKREIAALEADSAAAQDDLKNWTTDWHRALFEVGLDKDTSPGELLDFLEACDTIAAEIDEATKLEQRIVAIQADNEEFDQEVHALLKKVAPDLAQDNVVEAISKISVSLTESRTGATRYKSLAEQLDKAREELFEAKGILAASNETLKSLCQLAHCESPDDLAKVGRQAKERDNLITEIEELDVDLLNGGDGLTIEQLEDEIAEIDRDQLASELVRIKERLEDELHPQLSELIEKRGEAQRLFSEMSGTDDAARLAEEAEQIMSEIRSLAVEYTRTTVANRILRDEIERYRQEHRNPILEKAGRYFSRLTCDAYVEVATSYDQSDMPILVGVRADGDRKQVEQMSDGTRDQLYLALRLATLEHYADGSDVLPFVVDDILIQFDDSRSQSTLSTLAEFSGHTQVILFTHHLHVLDQANQLSATRPGVFVHEL